MPKWSNPYSELQQSIREALYDGLRRTNGYVSRDDYMQCASPGCADKADRLLLRLFSVQADGRLEWKPEIVAEEVLLQKLGGSTAIRRTDIITLWSRSRTLSLRTAYPSIAPAGKTSQHVGRHNWLAPVFGVDILVRPPTTFSDDRGDKSLRNALRLGEECFALVIHGTFNNGELHEDGEYLARFVVGDAFTIPKLASEISPVAGRCEYAMRAPLRVGDAMGAVNASLPYLNDFAGTAYMAFVS